LQAGTYVTLAAHRLLERVKRWHVVNVLVYAIWWGLFFVLVNVGIGLITTMFLSWLNDYLGDTFGFGLFRTLDPQTLDSTL
jgi:hypothetical protein